MRVRMRVRAGEGEEEAEAVRSGVPGRRRRALGSAAARGGAEECAVYPPARTAAHTEIVAARSRASDTVHADQPLIV
eukprot:scaffold119185_cov70-Phaeocystis_antarctica.AAC.1